MIDLLGYGSNIWANEVERSKMAAMCNSSSRFAWTAIFVDYKMQRMNYYAQ